MKTKFMLFAPIVLCVLLMTSCGESTRRSALSPVSGPANELLVIMNKPLYDGPIGDSIREFFGQAQYGLPQPEPLFDIINLPVANLENNVKTHRNILVIKGNNKLDSATMKYSNSPWANSQVYFEITTPNTEAFMKLFNEKKMQMLSTYLNAENGRLVNVYKKTPESKIFNLFRDKYNLLISCPAGYNINKQGENFLWMSQETSVDSRGIIFFQKPYESEAQFNYKLIEDDVNEVLKKNIPGPLENTWMHLDTETPITVNTYNYNKEHYAVFMRGLWDVENDFMGGPFVLNVILDQEYGRILYFMGYVYAPDGKKRNMLRQVEAIVNTIEFVKPAEEAETK